MLPSRSSKGLAAGVRRPYTRLEPGVGTFGLLRLSPWPISYVRPTGKSLFRLALNEGLHPL